jgi:hypothetical protein
MIHRCRQQARFGAFNLDAIPAVIEAVSVQLMESLAVALGRHQNGLDRRALWRVHRQAGT